MSRHLFVLILALLAPAAGAQARGDWWAVFSDPQLDRLEAMAAEGSTRIQVAAARMARAQALRRAARADRLPHASVGAAVARQGGPLINAAGGDG
ncbi:MAG: hypothetical protein RLZZ200_3160, partial [Pseudomonadota bacterium]